MNSFAHCTLQTDSQMLYVRFESDNRTTAILYIYKLYARKQNSLAYPVRMPARTQWRNVLVCVCFVWCICMCVIDIYTQHRTNVCNIPSGICVSLYWMVGCLLLPACSPVCLVLWSLWLLSFFSRFRSVLSAVCCVHCVYGIFMYICVCARLLTVLVVSECRMVRLFI